MDVHSIIVSIVVCTYNRAGILTETLEALENQSADKSLYEVIVVNNNSTDLTREVAERFASENINFRVVLETRQGTSYARNRGFAEANAEWVAYLDDDSRALSNYVERLIHVIRHYDFDCIGGVYLPWYRYGRPKWFKDGYGSNKQNISTIIAMPNDWYVSSGNCAFKKSLLVHYGGFPTHLGPKGNHFSYGEETYLLTRIKQDKKSIGFDPELLVEHAVMPHKLKLRWFFKSAFIHGIDSWHFFQIKPSLVNILRAFLSMFISPVAAFPSSIINLLNTHYYFQNFCIDLFMHSAGALGKIIGAFQRVGKSNG